MDLKNWIGRSEEALDTVSPTPYAALSATLDHELSKPALGTALPALWHWLYFLPLHRRSEMGTDGHAKLGDFLPPVSLPRRMWAASQFEFNEPIRIGDRLRRVSTIAGVDEKTGRTGALAFVKVRHEFYVNGSSNCALTEFHDIVYREARRPNDVEPPPRRAPTSERWQKQWTPDEVLLFRYSALTFNGHRIHYDRPYVTQAEGYPGLIVHGPLIATLLVDLLAQEVPQGKLVRFEFRALRPVFDMHPFFVCGEPDTDGKRIHLWARDHNGCLAMDAWAGIE